MKFLFKYFYVVFIITAILYGSTYLGPFSLRQWSTVFMCILLCKEKVKFKVDKVIMSYFGFLFFFFISALSEGALKEYVKDLIALHFVALIGYQASIVLVKKYSAEKFLLNTIVGIGIFTSLLTILQYYGLGIVTTAILDILNLHINEDFANRTEDMYGMLMANYALGGAFDNPVSNGYFLSLGGVLSLCYFLYANTFIKKIISLIPWAVIFYGCFCCQQRSAFIMLLAISIFSFFKYAKQFKFIVYLLIFVGIYWVYSNYTSLELGRYNELFDISSRDDVYSKGLEFVSQNLLLGGIGSFKNYTGGISPHNLFLNAFAYSGLFGTIFIINILLIQMKTCINLKVLFKGTILSIFILGYWVLTANALTHNGSIITGDCVFLIIWGTVVAIKEKVHINNIEV